MCSEAAAVQRCDNHFQPIELVELGATPAGAFNDRETNTVAPVAGRPGYSPIIPVDKYRSREK